MILLGISIDSNYGKSHLFKDIFPTIQIIKDLEIIFRIFSLLHNELVIF
jgi:hypothetical protein